jgi:hypothetical protein
MRNKANHRKLRAHLVLGLGAVSAALGACSSTQSPSNSPLPNDVKAVLFLQRMPRTDSGNVFDYTSFVPGGRLVKLEPPSADGVLTVLFPTTETCTQIYMDASGNPPDPSVVSACVTGSDIQSYDLSFDAKSVAFSARLADSGNYHIFTMGIDGSNAKQIVAGPNDYVYPIFLPGERILYTTNLNVEKFLDPSSMSSQFKDEYERATTAQVGTIAMGGTQQELGARNVSHRVSPALLPDGHVAYTEWRHMGGTNDGHLRMMNTDMTGMKEAFGGELQSGNPSTNSYLKARYVQTTSFTQPDGQTVNNYQMVTIATSRDRTLQAGKLFLINLNGSEANSTATDLTPLVPGDRTASQVGRYYDAEPVGEPADGKFLVSWADGPVESETLALAGSNAQFGVYLFDSKNASGKSGGRFPIWDDPSYWDVLARPVKQRAEPTPTTSPISGTDTTIGALNVYDSSVLDIPAGSIVKVRLIEGFSGEEGGVDMFGSTEFDGQSLYGEIPLQADNSFAATVPGNVPFHIQLLDKFAMAAASGQKAGGETDVANESIWISGRPGEQRFCGGCHESRSANTVIQPGVTEAVLHGAVNLVLPRAQRVSTTAYGLSTAGDVANAAGIKGVPWDKAIQPILDAQCVSCHGPDNKAGVGSYTVTDMTTMTEQTFNFDLSSSKLNVTVGERMTGDFTTSYVSIMGLGEILGDDAVTITSNGTSLISKAGVRQPLPVSYVAPAAAARSNLMKMLNPPQRFPAVDMNTRAFTADNLSSDEQAWTQTFATAHASVKLSADEFYLLILNIDMGGQFFFRENLDEAGQP